MAFNTEWFDNPWLYLVLGIRTGQASKQDLIDLLESDDETPIPIEARREIAKILKGETTFKRGKKGPTLSDRLLVAEIAKEAIEKPNDILDEKSEAHNSLRGEGSERDKILELLGEKLGYSVRHIERFIEEHEKIQDEISDLSGTARSSKILLAAAERMSAIDQELMKLHEKISNSPSTKEDQQLFENLMNSKLAELDRQISEHDDAVSRLPKNRQGKDSYKQARQSLLDAKQQLINSFSTR